VSGEVAIDVVLDEAAARKAIDDAEARSRASRAEAEELRRTSRNPRTRTVGSSGGAQGAIVGVLVVGLVATLVGEVVVEAVDKFLEDSGLDDVAKAVARLRELAERWSLPV